MKYERGKHPNTLKVLKEKGFKPEQSGNPEGRPPGTGLILLKPLIRVIDDQQSRIEIQASQISEYLKKLNEAEAELTDALAQIEELEGEIDTEDMKPDYLELIGKEIYEQQQNCERIKERLYKENDELKKRLSGVREMCETLQEELTLKNQRIDKLLDELKPYREAKMQEIKNRIGMENAGRARR